jgi:hypothetical protein
MKKPLCKVINAILCDDVRKEAGTNKHILIGTYSGDVRVGAELPKHSRFAVYLELFVPRGEHSLEMRFSGPGDESATMSAEIAQPVDGAAVLATPSMEVYLEREGVFRVDLKFGDGRWKCVLKKRVISRSIETQQPSEQSLDDAQATETQPA